MNSSCLEFGNPFETDPSTAPDAFQMELIDIQSQSDLKIAFTNNELLTFYKQYVSEEVFPTLVHLARRNISLLSRTYCMRTAFSRMKHGKSKSSSLISDEHLTGILRIATSTVGANTDDICKQKQCQISH